MVENAICTGALFMLPAPIVYPLCMYIYVHAVRTISIKLEDSGVPSIELILSEVTHPCMHAGQLDPMHAADFGQHIYTIS